MPGSLNPRAGPPYRGGIAITPNDSADLSRPVRALNNTTAGTIKVTTVDGDEITIGVAANAITPILAKKVWSTGTSAGTIIGLV